MLPNVNRLNKEADFRRLNEKGSWIVGRLYTIKWVNGGSRTKLIPSKIGITIGAKKMPRAVDRSKARRKTRETLRVLIKNGLIKPNFEIMLVPKLSVVLADYIDVKNELVGLLEKAGILLKYAKK